MSAAYFRLFLAFLLFCSLTRDSSAQTNEDEVRTRLVGKELLLRGMWGEDKLSFDAAGRPARLYARVPFTEAGIDIEKAKIKGDTLHLEGRRVGLEFGPKGAVSRVRIESKNYSGRLTIEIASSPTGFGSSLDVIFADKLEDLVPLLPSYWQSYASKHFLSKSLETLEATDVVPKHTNKSFLDTDRPIDSNGAPAGPAAIHDVETKPSHIAGSVRPPALIKSANPEFTEVARALKYSGNVEVYLWVDEDGSVSHLSIARPAGLGLDENALAAASKYKFKPATRNGEPVKVDLYIEVNFQIF